MSEIAKINKRPLPNLTELYDNVELVAKQNDLNILLSQQPKPEWVEEHPFARGVKYIPISILEYLMTSIFVNWRVEIIDSKVIANAVVVTVRVHAQDPITGEMICQDGIGAAPIQTQKGAAATDFEKVLTDAVVKAAPAAESYAFKDAVEKWGRLFGKDLNRKQFLPYTNLEGKIDLSAIDINEVQQTELYDLLRKASLHPDEEDNYRIEIANGISVAEYQTMKRILIDKQLSPNDKIRNGLNVSMGEINQAVKTVMQD